ncbi:hypothetical protein WICPIJ_003909 [Wickerhamomyces pijperi]|uniref:Uncharacterized protein n=1 Tax=Wickerhamomyces pijperi TaxID=599730 RepID=A0A9P8Q6B7_WICPI|nr:hypothetical protein WICPIJ_003909 [Wickerhamomyces pijperi]
MYLTGEVSDLVAWDDKYWISFMTPRALKFFKESDIVDGGLHGELCGVDVGDSRDLRSRKSVSYEVLSFFMGD